MHGALRSAALAFVVSASAVAAASAQSYPNRVIKLVLPFPAGGPTDGAARLIADRLSAELGQNIVIENRPGGAGGTVGAKSVATAEPDGYTLLFTPPGALVTAPLIYKNIGYDPAKDFAPVAAIFSSPQVLVVNPKVPAKSMRELVDYAKANPGKLSYASPGFATQPHLLGEMLKLQTGTDILHVPFRGSAPALTDLLAGQVQIFFDTTTFLLPHAEGGELRPLAVADGVRSPQLPDVPTTAEAGYPKLRGTYWTGVAAPAGTPPDVIGKLNRAVNAVLTSKDMQETLTRLSAKGKPGTPADFGAFLDEERRRWAEVIQAAGIKAE